MDGSGSTAATFRSMFLPLSWAVSHMPVCWAWEAGGMVASAAMLVWSFRRMYSIPYGGLPFVGPPADWRSVLPQGACVVYATADGDERLVRRWV